MYSYVAICGIFTNKVGTLVWDVGGQRHGMSLV